MADDEEEMEMEAFNGSMIATVRNLFPFNTLASLSEQRGTGREKMHHMISFIQELRENRQEMMKNYECQSLGSVLGGSSGSSGGSGGSSGGSGGKSFSGFCEASIYFK